MAHRLRASQMLVLLVLVTCIGGLAAWGLDRSCAHMLAPVETPEVGTPRADWCRAQRLATYWLLAGAVPIVLTAAASLITRRTIVLSLIAAAAIGVVLVDTVVADSLDGAFTI